MNRRDFIQACGATAVAAALPAPAMAWSATPNAPSVMSGLKLVSSGQAGRVMISGLNAAGEAVSEYLEVGQKTENDYAQLLGIKVAADDSGFVTVGANGKAIISQFCEREALVTCNMFVDLGSVE